MPIHFERATGNGKNKHSNWPMVWLYHSVSEAGTGFPVYLLRSSQKRTVPENNRLNMVEAKSARICRDDSVCSATFRHYTLCTSVTHQYHRHQLGTIFCSYYSVNSSNTSTTANVVFHCQASLLWRKSMFSCLVPAPGQWICLAVGCITSWHQTTL